jgi:CHAT domain-containing protein
VWVKNPGHFGEGWGLALNKGMSKVEAVQRAKLKSIQTRENGMSFVHPFLWAAFVLVGK